jgi:integrase
VTIDRDYEDLRGDGRIVLFLREGRKPKYHVRLKVPNASGYKFVSTKTSDRNEAVRLAMNFYDELYHHIKVGGSIKSNTFADVFKEWKNSRRNAYQKVETKDRSVEYVATYALDYFGKARIDQLTARDFHSYWDWRKLNFKRKKPTDDTLNRERNAIQSLKKFALQRGHVTRPFKIPKLETKGINRRPTFTLAEWKMSDVSTIGTDLKL